MDLDDLIHCTDEALAEAHEPDLPNEGAHPELTSCLTAVGALEKLRAGNEEYRNAQHNRGDISQNKVEHLFKAGQAPFACIVACSDSRVVPEHIFMTGLGELFCIRVAGNVIGPMELASCLYAAEHLHTRLILVLGHTHCGAIETGMEMADALKAEEGHGAPTGAAAAQSAITPLAEQVIAAIGDERDPYRAAVLNVSAGLEALKASPEIAHLVAEEGVWVRGAIYHTHSGEVEFL